MTTTTPARDVAIVAFAHAAHSEASPGTTNGVEMLAPVFAEYQAKTTRPIPLFELTRA